MVKTNKSEYIVDYNILRIRTQIISDIVTSLIFCFCEGDNLYYKK